MVVSDTGNTIRGDFIAVAVPAIQSNHKVICSYETSLKSADDGSSEFMVYIKYTVLVHSAISPFPQEQGLVKQISQAGVAGLQAENFHMIHHFMKDLSKCHGSRPSNRKASPSPSSQFQRQTAPASEHLDTQPVWAHWRT